MVIELSDIIFTDQDDVVPVSGVAEIINTGIANTLDGHDTITSTGVLYNEGIINTGNGEDFIISYRGFSNSGLVFLGEGNDSLIGAAHFSDRALENFNVIDTGNGDDYISASSNLYNGGIINTGNGNDSIYSSRVIYNNGRAIITGIGNDSIYASEGFGSGPNGSGDWFLGEGNDYLHGFGSGDFYGGNGYDIINFSQAPAGTYTVGIWGEGQDKSVIFTKGNQQMITSEFELLINVGILYNFANLTAGQTIVVGFYSETI